MFQPPSLPADPSSLQPTRFGGPSNFSFPRRGTSGCPARSTQSCASSPLQPLRLRPRPVPVRLPVLSLLFSFLRHGCFASPPCSSHARFSSHRTARILALHRPLVSLFILDSPVRRIASSSASTLLLSFRGGSVTLPCNLSCETSLVRDARGNPGPLSHTAIHELDQL